MLGLLLKVQMWFCMAGARDSAPCQKWAKREGFGAVPKTMAGMGHLKRICKDAFSVAGAVQETCSSDRDVRRSGCWFPERGCILEYQIFRFAKMILRDRCSTSSDLASLLRGKRSTLDRWSGKSQNALVRGRQLCTHFWRGSRRIASFLMLPTSKFKKSRRIASFLTLSSWNIEEISQNSFVFKLADRQRDR